MHRPLSTIFWHAMLVWKWLKDCTTMRLAIFLVVSRRNDKKNINCYFWTQMAEQDCGLCLFYWFGHGVNQLTVVTSWRNGLLDLSKFPRCKHSKPSIYLSRNDFLILLHVHVALVWCQINLSYTTKSRIWL